MLIHCRGTAGSGRHAGMQLSRLALWAGRQVYHDSAGFGEEGGADGVRQLTVSGDHPPCPGALLRQLGGDGPSCIEKEHELQTSILTAFSS